MTPSEIAHLKALCAAATPGPWQRCTIPSEAPTHIVQNTKGMPRQIVRGMSLRKHDCDFIAAANPAALTALLDENERFQEQLRLANVDALLNEAQANDLRQALREACDLWEKGLSPGLIPKYRALLDGGEGK